MRGFWRGAALASSIMVASLVAGVGASVAVGWIPGLASDVGRDGAWFLLVLFQLLFAMLSLVAFGMAALASRWRPALRPSLLPATATAAFVAVLFIGVLELIKLSDPDWLIVPLVLLVSFTVAVPLLYAGAAWFANRRLRSS